MPRRCGLGFVKAKVIYSPKLAKRIAKTCLKRLAARNQQSEDIGWAFAHALKNVPELDKLVATEVRKIPLTRIFT